MSILALPRGLHPGVPTSVYHARTPGIASKSLLDLVRRSPAHAKAWLDGLLDEGEAREALFFGSAFHMALLEPDRFAETYVVEPDFGDCRRKENKISRDEWRSAHVGRTPLSAYDELAIIEMVSAVRRHPLASKMVVGGVSELTARWTDATTGLECKARADYFHAGLRMLVDVKTTIDGRASSFRRSVANFLYYRQDAFYRDGFAAAGADVDHFVFLAVEKSRPHLVSLFAIDGEAVRRGRETIREDLEVLARCFEADEWPGYPGSIQVLELPAWA